MRMAFQYDQSWHFTRWTSIDSWTRSFDWINDVGYSLFWFYPNNFKEHDTTNEELLKYRQSVESANTAGLNPFSLFGGYFCMLLSFFGLRHFQTELATVNGETVAIIAEERQRREYTCSKYIGFSTPLPLSN